MADMSDRSNAARPNIVLLLSDDQGWGDIGWHGHPTVQTPNLDAMAENGLRLDRFYVAPFCMPTRAWCISGRAPHRVGYQIGTDDVTVPRLLGTAGYRTGHFGKWHLGQFGPDLRAARPDVRDTGAVDLTLRYLRDELWPWDIGFDTCFSAETNFSTFNVHDIPPHWSDPARYGCDTYPWSRSFHVGPGQCVTEGLRGSTDILVADRAIEFMREAHEQRTPFLAVVWFSGPHRPIVAGPAYRALYREEPEAAQHFFGTISALDEAIGRIRATLRNLGVADNTLVWYSSDNGPQHYDETTCPHCLGSSGGLKGRKGSVWEGGVRVPAAIEWPAQIRGGRRSDFTACIGDVLPTLARAAGAGIPSDLTCDGMDLLPLFQDAVTERPDPIAIEGTRSANVALIGQQYKLVRQPAGGTELYDLSEDPEETQDLSGAQTAHVRSCVDRLRDWQDSVEHSLVERARTHRHRDHESPDSDRPTVEEQRQ